MVKDFVFGAGHPKVCLGFSPGHITGGPQTVQGWREWSKVAILVEGRPHDFTVSGRKHQESKQVLGSLGAQP